MRIQVLMPWEGVDVPAVPCPRKGLAGRQHVGIQEAGLTGQVETAPLRGPVGQICTVRLLPAEPILHWEPQTQAF